MTTLQSLLERYLRVPVDFKQNKSQKLNLFLNKFISELEENSGKENIRNMKSVCNILVGEFLVDVHQICHDCEGADTAPLQEYLLHGRGCVILKVLSTIGVQNVSSGLELAELLVSTLPLCLKFPRSSDSEGIEEANKLPDLRSCIFGSHLPTRSQRRSSKFPQITQVISTSSSKRLTSPSRHHQRSLSNQNMSQVKRSRSGGNSPMYGTDGSSSAVARTNGIGRRNVRSGFTMAIKTPSRYESGSSASKNRMPSLSTSDSETNGTNGKISEGPLGIFRGLLSAPSSDQEIATGETLSDEEIVPLPDLHIDPLELCVMLINIVQEICKQEPSSLNNAKIISNGILPHIGELLTLIGEEISPLSLGQKSEELTDGWSEFDYILIQRHLLRLIFSTSRAIAIQPSGCLLLKTSQILHVLVEVAEGLRKELEQFDALTNEYVQQKWQAKLDLMLEINEGFLLLMENVLLSIAVNPSNISLLMQFTQEYHTTCGDKLTTFVTLILQENYPKAELSTEHYEMIAARTVAAISNLVIAMKKMKVNYIHSVKCSKKCHKACEYSGWTHHHHDVLGISSLRYKTDKNIQDASLKSYQLPCSVSVLTEYLLNLLAGCKERTLIVRLMCSLEDCGICCCVSPELLTSNLLIHLESQTPAMRNYILILWTRLLLEQCGGAKHSEKKGCSINCCVCEDGSVDDDNQGLVMMPGHLSDSAFSSGDDNAFPLAGASPSKWNFLKKLCMFVFHNQQPISIQVTQHLLRLVCHGTVALRKALFRHVLLPVFSRTLPDDVMKRKRRYQDEAASGRPVSEKVTNYCLSALPLLLQCREIFNIFVNIGGIEKLCQYVNQDVCRKATLKALMVMVILEERTRQMYDNQAQSSNDSLMNDTQRQSESEPVTAKDDAVTINMLLILLMDTQILDTDLSIKSEPQNMEHSKATSTYNAATAESLAEKFASSDEGIQLENKQISESEDQSTDKEETGIVIEPDSRDQIISADISGESSIASPKVDETFPSGTEYTSQSEKDADSQNERDNIAAEITNISDTQTQEDVKTDTGCHGNTEKLSLLCDLWDCANVLFHQSSSFKHQFLSNSGTQTAHAILEKCLAFLSTCDCANVPSFSDQGTNNVFVLVLGILRSVLSICMSSCNAAVLAGQWNTSTDDLVVAVKDAWVTSHVMRQGQGLGFKVMCDMLLSCASQQRLASDLLQHHVFTVMHLKCDDDVYTEFADVSESSSSQESEYTSLDLGYEADSEVTYEDSSQLSDKWNELDRTRPRTFQQPFAGSMPHPQLCHVVLDTLIQYTAVHQQTAIVSHVLLKMISIAKQNVYNAMAMYAQNMVELILSRFQQVLKSSTNATKMESYPVELTLLLDLFLVITKNSFHAKELRMCLRLFQESNPPINLLLHTLTVLAENLTPQPPCILCFPVITSTLASDLELTSKSLSGDTLSISVQATDEESYEEVYWSRTLSRSIQPTQDPNLTTSPSTHDIKHYFKMPYPIRSAPVQLVLKPSPIWPVVKGKEFSASLWLRVEDFKRDVTAGAKSRHARRQESTAQHFISASGRVQSQAEPRRPRYTAQLWNEQCLHVFSLGNDELMLETWIEPETCNLVFRVLSCYLDNNEGLGVLGEACITNLCDTEKWHHLTLSFSEKIMGPNAVIQISSVVDGCHEKQMKLEYSRSRITYVVKETKIRDNHVYIGHSVAPWELPDTHGSWQLGTFMLFEDCALNKASSLYLCALGPATTSLVQCDNGMQHVSLAHLISEKVMTHCDLNPGIFSGTHPIHIESLRNKLMLIFNPRNPAQFLLYDKPPPSPSAVPSAKEYTRQVLSQHASLLSSTLNTDLAPQEHRGLSMAIAETGGIGAFLFLVAKVIGMGASESQQAQAIKLLCTLLRKNPAHRRQMKQLEGYTMLSKAFSSDRCRLGNVVLKVLLDYCLTSSVLQHNKTSDSYMLNSGNRALIHDVYLIYHVLLDWRVWQNARTEVWLLMFRALENLVDPEHPHHSFNIAQLVNFNIIVKLLNICLERIQAEYPSVPLEIAEIITSIISHVINESRENTVHHMLSLWDFLLLVHPAANTFVHNGASDFYYRNTRDIGASSKSLKATKSTSQNTGLKTSLSLGTLSSQDVYVNVDLKSSDSASKEPTDYDAREAVESPYSGETSPQTGDNRQELERSNSYPFAKEKRDEIKADLQSSRSMPHLLQKGEPKIEETFTEETSKFSSQLIAKVDVASVAKTVAKSLQGYKQDSSDHSDEDIASISKTAWGEKHKIESEQSRISPNFDVGTGLIPDAAKSFKEEIPSTSTFRDEPSDEDVLKPIWRPTSDLTGSRATSPGSALKDDGRIGALEESLDMDSELESRAWKAYNDVENDLGLHTLCTGTLDILTRIMTQLQDKDIDHVTAFIRPGPLIVMANHCASQVRAAVIKLLDVYLPRARDHDLATFLKMDGFHLLANQLYQFPATADVIEACVSIVAARPFSMGDDLDPSQLQDMTAVQKHAIVPVLALFTASVKDISICHNLFTQINLILACVDDMLPTLLDSGLCECLIKVIQQLNDMEPQLSDLGDDEYDILWQDLTDLVTLLVQKTFCVSKASIYSYLEDFLALLTTAAQHATIEYGKGSEQEERLYRILCITYKVIFNVISQSMDSGGHVSPTRGKGLTQTVGGIISLFNPLSSKSNERDPLVLAPPRPYGGGGPSERRGGASSRQPLTTRSMSQNVRRHSERLSTSGLESLLMSGAGRRTVDFSMRDRTDRFKRILLLAADLVMFTDGLPSMDKDEDFDDEDDEIENRRASMLRNHLPCFLLMYVKNAVVMAMEKGYFDRKSLLVNMYWSCKEIIKVQFCRLFCHMISTSMPIEVRLFSLAMLADEFKCQQLVKIMTNTYATGAKMVLLLYTLLRHNERDLTKETRSQANEVMTALHQCRYEPIRLGTRLDSDRRRSIEDELLGWEKEHRQHALVWLTRLIEKKALIDRKFEPLTEQVRAHALEVTQQVSQAQSKERRKLIEMLKTQMANRLQTKKAWQQLIQQLTHERAVWFDEKSEPKSWQLDPTEGPGRMRKRLQKCKLGIQPRFLTEPYRYKLECEELEPQLAYLFEEDIHGSDSKALIYKLHTSQSIQMTSFCKNVTPSGDTPGSLLIGQQDVYFVADQAIADPHSNNLLLGNHDVLYVTLPYDAITGLHKRWYQLQDNALEIFLTNGKTCLFSFHDKELRNSVYKFLAKLELPNRVDSEDCTKLQQAWMEGKVTNYDYLCQLNTLAGRSFNDLMQYPVYPFILSQYTEESLDLCDPNSYRALDKPISIQHEDRRQRYIEHYDWLEYEQRMRRQEELVSQSGASRGGAFSDSPSSLYHSAPFHYGSHYSNSGTVLHFLVRLPPFTQMFLEYQDRNFDVPDRTFHAMATTWRLASYDSTTDVKELIPEFFYLPEFLTNFEGFNFGSKQNGQVVNHINLPPWCENDPELFVRIHRQALESDHVTAHLQAWIDLVFGYKQKGKAAVDAVNVFHPATYFGVDVNKIPDVVNRAALKTAIATYGQTPKQLFKNGAHPKSTKPPTLTTRPNGAPIPQGLPHVQGLKWGTYVGSPACEEPKCGWLQRHGAQISSLVSIPSGEVFGLGACSHLLVMYSQDKGRRGTNKRDVVWAAILSWGNPESVIRIKNKKDKPAVNFLRWNPEEKVTCCASVPDCRLLLFGSDSGVITALNTKFNPSKASHMQVFSTGVKLYGHTGLVSAISVCAPFSVLVSASHDKTLIIWDLNRLSYVRTITSHDQPVQCVTVSDTQADIASVSHQDTGSTLMLHSVNGVLRGKVTCHELITCVTFSTEPEGRSINVLVAGLSNGRVRMWSTWNLMPVRDLAYEGLTLPIISVTFNKDNQRLFVSAADGTVACWERPGYKGKEIVFIPFLN